MISYLFFGVLCTLMMMRLTQQLLLMFNESLKLTPQIRISISKVNVSYSDISDTRLLNFEPIISASQKAVENQQNKRKIKSARQTQIKGKRSFENTAYIFQIRHLGTFNFSHHFVANDTYNSTLIIKCTNKTRVTDLHIYKCEYELNPL